jgi:hypothetical protein
LFFLDEVTGLAAGHRPCFECRRKVAQVFAALFLGGPRAADMDRILHAERLDGKLKRLHWRKIEGLPDATIIVVDGSPVALRGKRLLRWTPRGYNRTIRRPRGVDVAVLTPPSILAVLERGYRPLWHPSAD